MHNKISDLTDKLYERLFSYLQWNSNNRYEKRYAFSYQLHCIKNTLVATGLKQYLKVARADHIGFYFTH